MEINKTFCNVGLDAETIAADIITGQIYSPQYLKLHEWISQIPEVPEVYQVQNILDEMKVHLLSKTGTIDNSETSKFILGDNPQMKEAFMLLHDSAIHFLDLYDQAVVEFSEHIVKQTYDNVKDQDFAGIGLAYNVTAGEFKKLADMEKIQDKLETIKSSCANILELYGSDTIISKKVPGLRVGNNANYREYLFDLQSTPELYDGAIQAPMCVVKIANVLYEALNIKNPLDPFETDQAECLLKVLTHPKKFYSYCKNNEIISTNIGQIMHQVYPEHYFYTYDIYLDSTSKLSFQENLQFSKSFGLMTNFTNILQHPPL